MANLMLKTFLSASLAVNPITSTGRLMLHTFYIVFVMTEKKRLLIGGKEAFLVHIVWTTWALQIVWKEFIIKWDGNNQRPSWNHNCVCWVWADRSESSTRVLSSTRTHLNLNLQMCSTRTNLKIEVHVIIFMKIIADSVLVSCSRTPCLVFLEKLPLRQRIKM